MTDETRIVGALPNLRVEIVHRQDPGNGADHLYLHFATLPGAPSAFASPLAAWTAMGEAMMAQWFDLTAAFLPWALPWAAMPTRPDTGTRNG
jgi:hypothetical protein